MTQQKNEKINVAYDSFKEEAELFFVTKYLESAKIDAEYKFCLDVILNLSNTIDFARGLIAFNKSYGQGKTFFFDVVHHRVKRKSKINIYKKTSARELCNIYLNAGNKEKPTAELDKFIQVKSLYICDIGDELADGKERTVYGNKLNVLRYVLLRRYELWIEKGYKLFGDTNLTIDQIGANYGGRVADRIQQMVYWRHFQFLPDKSTFRQRTDTRKLTQEEIRHNALKVQKKEVVDRVDLDKYFNEMLQEDEDKLKNQASYFWDFCKNYLIKKEIIKQSDFDLVINEEMLKTAKVLLMAEKKTAIKGQVASMIVYAKKSKQLEKTVDKDDIRRFAEGMKVKEIFLNLKKQNHKF